MPTAAYTFGFPIHNIKAFPVVRSLMAAAPPFRMTSQEEESAISKSAVLFLTS